MTRKSKKDEKCIESESTVESNDKYRFLILPGKSSSIMILF